MDRLQKWTEGGLSAAEADLLQEELAQRSDGAELIELFSPLSQVEAEACKPSQPLPAANDESANSAASSSFKLLALAAACSLVFIGGRYLINGQNLELSLQHGSLASLNPTEEVRVAIQTSGSFQELAYVPLHAKDELGPVRFLEVRGGQKEIRQRALGLTGGYYGLSSVYVLGGDKGCVSDWMAHRQYPAQAERNCVAERLDLEIDAPELEIQFLELGQALIGGKQQPQKQTFVVESRTKILLRTLPLSAALKGRSLKGLDLQLQVQTSAGYRPLETNTNAGHWEIDLNRVMPAHSCRANFRIIINKTATLQPSSNRRVYEVEVLLKDC